MCSSLDKWIKMCLCVCMCVCFQLLSHVLLSATPLAIAWQTLLSKEFLQARMLEWVAISYSRGSAWPRDWTHISCVSCMGRQILYQLHNLGSPNMCLQWNITLPRERRRFCHLWWHGCTLSDYAKWNKSGRAGQIVYDLICMWNRKSWIHRKRE